MNPLKANIRSTIFTNKPIEIDYEKSLKIVTRLQQYQLFSFPVNGFSFQLGPKGMTPTTLTSYEFRNSDNSLNISLGPDRIDINYINIFDDIRPPLQNMFQMCQEVLSAFQGCIDFKVVRLALASVWSLTDVNLDEITAKVFNQPLNSSLIEWDKRKVERKLIPDTGILVNFGEKLSRGQVQLPLEQVLKDRIIIDIDINTVPLPPDILNPDNISIFFTEAIEASISLIKKTIKDIEL